MLGHFRRTLLTARQCEVPFRHWLLDDALPPFLSNALAALPFAPPVIGDTKGRRETNNATRHFVTPVECHEFTMLIYLSTHPDAAEWGTAFPTAAVRPAAQRSTA
jgi:hypothetical protein